MTTTDSFTEAFRDEMLDSGLLIAGPVDGLYGRSSVYERVADAVEGYLTRFGADEVEEYVRFPPVLPRSVFEQTGYLSSFPDLMGSVHSFVGNDRQHAEMVDLAESGQPWAESLDPTDVMLCSAACHSVYPRYVGVLPEGGHKLQVSSWCFRHEPSRALTRMQSFRMLEHVYVGAASDVAAWRERWITRSHRALVDLGLDIEMVAANDPFFGRGGRLLARSQRDEELKYEFVTPFDARTPPVAIASSNLHLDHFGETFGISTASGEVAHSTCIGWGWDRIVLALFRHHGTDPRRWPADACARLWP